MPPSSSHCQDAADKSPRARTWLGRAVLGTSLCPASVVRQLRLSGVVSSTVTARLETRSRWHLGLWVMVALWLLGTLGGTLLALRSDTAHHRHHLGGHMRGAHAPQDFFGTLSASPPVTPLGFRVRGAAEGGGGGGGVEAGGVGGVHDPLLDKRRLGGGLGPATPSPSLAPSPIPALQEVKPLHLRWFGAMNA